MFSDFNKSSETRCCGTSCEAACDAGMILSVLHWKEPETNHPTGYRVSSPIQLHFRPQWLSENFNQKEVNMFVYLMVMILNKNTW